MLVIKGGNKMSSLQIMGNFEEHRHFLLEAPFKQPRRVHLKPRSETPKLKKISHFSIKLKTRILKK